MALQTCILPMAVQCGTPCIITQVCELNFRKRPESFAFDIVNPTPSMRNDQTTCNKFEL